MAPDKKLHRWAGLVMPFAFVALIKIAEFTGPLIAALLASVAIAVGKELVDPHIGGQREMADIAHTVLGIVVATATLFVFGVWL